ncbi:hypothetical protein AB0C13_30250 [Streptomyces sp. NPDC049099]|uniref:hypothetical protein n=1 Tax=Streptomyces sp. NPDC049099 TaxID=3155768 RepID=UPI003435F3D0
MAPVTKTPENSAPWRPGHRTVAVLGSFVPLRGIPSAASLAVDMVLGRIAHRRGRRTCAYEGAPGMK